MCVCVILVKAIGCADCKLTEASPWRACLCSMASLPTTSPPLFVPCSLVIAAPSPFFTSHAVSKSDSCSLNRISLGMIRCTLPHDGQHSSRDDLAEEFVLGEWDITRVHNKAGSDECSETISQRKERELQYRDDTTPLSVSSCNAIIAAYAANGDGKKGIELFRQMQQERLEPDVFTYVSVLRACSSIAALTDGRSIHSSVVEDGLDSNTMVDTGLVNMYGKCGAIAEARLIFEEMDDRSVVSWNAMIAAYARHGHCQESIELFKQMQQEGLKPNKITFASVLPACTHLAALQEGRMIHASIIDCGLDSDIVVGSALIHMYGKCGACNDARSVFDKARKGNVIFWTAMIFVLVQQCHSKEALQLFGQMQREGLEPNEVTFISALSACASVGALMEGRLIHACIVESGFESHIGVGNALVHMYGECESVADAHLVFAGISRRDLISWNSMITAFTQDGRGEFALQLFQQMQQEDINPDAITCINLLSACSSLEALGEGKVIHLYILDNGFESDVVVATALIDMYGKCRVLEDAQSIFNHMHKRNIVSWTAIITAYAQQGQGKQAIKMFQKMRVEGFRPNKIALVSVLSAYASLGTIAEDDVIRQCIECSFESDVGLGNALISMYGKCGAVEDARSIFDKLLQRNVVSWNSMIAAYGQHGFGKEALQLFHRMQEENINPNEITLVNCLTVCATFGALAEGKEMHKYIIQRGFESNTSVGNALVHMYGKCGALEDANSVLYRNQRDVVSWNSIIAAYAQQGCAEETFKHFRKMQEDGVKPDGVTFLTILTACSHAGMVIEGFQFFKSMVEDHKIVPTVDHYGCMIHLFGHAGRLDVAENLIYKMPLEPTAVVWRNLLGACRIHGDIERGSRAFDYLCDLEPQNAAPYVLLASMFAGCGRWDDVEKVRRRMVGRGVRKLPGCSVIEINNTIHTFYARDRSHPETEAIYRKLEGLNSQLIEEGYVPDTRLVLHDAGEEQKKFMLSHHSERLAMSFGLISTPSGAPLLIIKNLRMCFDCHTAFKFCSIIVNRDITLRDASRFHHFKHGVCSCGDYW